MILPKTLLDTDILSKLLRQESLVVSVTQRYLATHPQLTFSIITQYEITRGLKAKAAQIQLQNFVRFCAVCELLPLTEDVIETASDICADLSLRGCLIGDADILIAATALSHGLTLATNNEQHFCRIHGLQIENWSV